MKCTKMHHVLARRLFLHIKSKFIVGFSFSPSSFRSLQNLVHYYMEKKKCFWLGYPQNLESKPSRTQNIPPTEMVFRTILTYSETLLMAKKPTPCVNITILQ